MSFISETFGQKIVNKKSNKFLWNWELQLRNIRCVFLSDQVKQLESGPESFRVKLNCTSVKETLDIIKNFGIFFWAQTVT